MADMKRWLLVLLGAVCVMPLAAVDPAAGAMLFDVELLALLGSVGLAMLRGDARAVWYELIDRPGILIFRAGIRLTRERPASLLDA